MFGVLVLFLVGVRLFYCLAYDRCVKYQFDVYYPNWVQAGKPQGIWFGGAEVRSPKLGRILFKRMLLDSDRFVVDDRSRYLLAKFKRWETLWVYSLVVLFPTLALGRMLIE